jgi:HlyD family secretion protein
MADDLAKLRIQRGALPGRTRKRWFKWALLAALAAVVIAVLALRPRVEEVTTTSVVTTYPSQQFVALNATGYAVAQRKAAVSSKATGRLDWLGVAEGSRVKEGELIARLDARDVSAQADAALANVRTAQTGIALAAAGLQQSQAQIAQAEAGIAQAQAEATDATANLSRTRDLAAKGFLSAANVDTALAREQRAQAAVAAARATLASARAAVASAQAGIASNRSSISAAQASSRNAQVAVDFTEIRAPFDGVVLTKNANVGDIITPFSSAAGSQGAVVTMADMSTLEVEADVSESSVSKIKVGQPAEIVLDAIPDTRFRGSVARMVPTVDRAKATVMTKVKFETLDPRILPEMSAKVTFLTQAITADQQKPYTAVSPEAIVERDGKQVAFVVKDNKVSRVELTLGGKVNDFTTISAGLKAGDKVVLRPSAKLTDGAAVKVVTK